MEDNSTDFSSLFELKSYFDDKSFCTHRRPNQTFMFYDCPDANEFLSVTFLVALNPPNKQQKSVMFRDTFKNRRRNPFLSLFLVLLFIEKDPFRLPMTLEKSEPVLEVL